jgi:PAS domain S-box-containing protein
MKKVNAVWNVPYFFFVFLSIFTMMKFIFIFFFRTAYEPPFLFELTPLHLLSGFDSAQLLVASLIILLIDTVLHRTPTRRHLLFSFLFTGVLLLGIGCSIAFNDMSSTLLIHYLLFGCLLLTLLIDHNHMLHSRDIIPAEEPIMPQVAPKVKVKQKRIKKPKPAKISRHPASLVVRSITKPNIGTLLHLRKKSEKPVKSPILPKIPQPASISVQKPPVSSSPSVENLTISQQQVQTVDQEQTQDMLDALKKKTEKLKKLEEEIEQRRKRLVNEERRFKRELVSQTTDHCLPSDSKKADGSHHPGATVSSLPSLRGNLLDQIQASAALIQRGMIKQINDSFLQLLGYNTKDIIDRRLLNFIAPESFGAIKQHYLARLNGEESTTYEAVLLTKDNVKKTVKVHSKTFLVGKEKTELAVFTINEKNDRKEERKTW